MDLAKIGAETRQIVLDVLDKAALVEGDILFWVYPLVRLLEAISVRVPVWKLDRSLSKP